MAGGRSFHRGDSPQLSSHHTHSYPTAAETSRSRRPASISSGSGVASYHQLPGSSFNQRINRPDFRNSVSGLSAPYPVIPPTSSYHLQQASMTGVQASHHAASHHTTSHHSAAHHSTPQTSQLAHGMWAMPKMKQIGGPSSQSTPTEPIRKTKGRKKNRANTNDMDRPCKEHSFITDVADIQNMQDGLLKLMSDFESGKLSAFDEHCSFEKMNNVRDLQEKLGRMHFKMETDIKNAGANTKEGIDTAIQNMDHLLSNLDQLSMAIQSLHPPGDPTTFHPDQPI